jgi:hypothetical protein
MDGENRMLWVQWLAMAVATLVLPAVTTSLAGAPHEDPMVPLVALLPAVPELIIAIAVLPRILVKTPAQSAFVIRWAFLVSAAIFAGVASYMGATAWLVVPVVAAAFLGMLTARPSAEAYTAWEVRRMEQDG